MRLKTKSIELTVHMLNAKAKAEAKAKDKAKKPNNNESKKRKTEKYHRQFCTIVSSVHTEHNKRQHAVFMQTNFKIRQV